MKTTVLGLALLFSVSGYAAIVPVLNVEYWHSSSNGFVNLESQCHELGGELISKISGKVGGSTDDPVSFAGACKIGSSNNATINDVMIPVLQVSYWHSTQNGPTELKEKCENLGGVLTSSTSKKIGGSVYDSKSFAGICKIPVSLFN